MKPLLVAMCGLAFSGKSTVAQRLVSSLDAELIVLDHINEARGLIGGDGSMSKEQWLETHAIALSKSETYLQSGQSVVIDDTFSHRFLRDQALAIAHTHQARFAIAFVEASLADIQHRRSTNEKDTNSVADLRPMYLKST